jgi:hypothetical protein
VLGIKPNGISSFQVPATGKFVIQVKKMFKVARKMIITGCAAHASCWQYQPLVNGI